MLLLHPLLTSVFTARGLTFLPLEFKVLEHLALVVFMLTLGFKAEFYTIGLARRVVVLRLVAKV